MARQSGGTVAWATTILLIGGTGLVPSGPLDAQEVSWRTDTSRRTVELSEIVPGGPPKDGIPALDRPRFIAPAAASWLAPREPVMIVSSGGRTKIYPLQILIWHEIVNDVVGAVPVAVTYCPLCNTALAFDRRAGGRLLDFGTTGRLRHSDLIMYDRQTETWWQQATGEAIVGELSGQQLVPVAAQLLGWQEARRLFPDAVVLSRDTGHDRPYGRNPYSGYDRGSGPMPGFFSGRPDGRLQAMERVVAIEVNGASAAYGFEGLRRRQVRHDTLGGTPLVIFWASGTASALDDAQLANGRDVGASAVFDARLDGASLHFDPAGDGLFRDRQTGSTWNLAGEAQTGPHAGRRLTPMPHGNPFWFAWAAFRPEATLKP